MSFDVFARHATGEAYFCFIHSFSMRHFPSEHHVHHVRRKKNKPVLLSFLVPNKTFAYGGLQAGDHTDVAQEEQLGLHCWPKIWATCVEMDVSRCLRIPTLEVSAMLGVSSILPGYEGMHQLLVLHILVALQ